MPLKRQLDLVEASLICIFALGVGSILGYRSAQLRNVDVQAINALTAESRALEQKYGPASNSQYEEEWILKDFFGDKRDGVFVDVGANHFQQNSNTYYLEVVMGWSGLAIEPLRQFEPDYLVHRPRTRFRAFFASDVSNEQAKMYMVKGNELVSSVDRGFTEAFGGKAQEVTVPTVRLSDLLDSEKVTRVDFISIDVELHEPEVLAGFDLQRFRPALACIEAHPQVRQQILDYFTRRGYVVVGKYLRADTQNLYFQPLS
jgi:FkbM family methyltransferase